MTNKDALSKHVRILKTLPFAGTAKHIVQALPYSGMSAFCRHCLLQALPFAGIAFCRHFKIKNVLKLCLLQVLPYAGTFMKCLMHAFTFAGLLKTTVSLAAQQLSVVRCHCTEHRTQSGSTARHTQHWSSNVPPMLWSPRAHSAVCQNHSFPSPFFHIFIFFVMFFPF